MERLAIGKTKITTRWILLLLSFVFVHCDHVAPLDGVDTETGTVPDFDTNSDSQTDTIEDTGSDTSPPEFSVRGWTVPGASIASQNTLIVSGGIAPSYATQKSTDGRFSVVHVGVASQLVGQVGQEGQEGVTQ